MKVFIFILFAALFLGCSDGGRDTVELEVNYTLEQGRTCQTYLADHFLVTVYDSEQRKVTEKQIKCDSENPDTMRLVVEKGFYYISVVLRSADKLWQSYGAKKVEVTADSKETIEMKDYIGGMTFIWNSSDCSKYNISTMSLNLNRISGIPPKEDSDDKDTASEDTASEDTTSEDTTSEDSTSEDSASEDSPSEDSTSEDTDSETPVYEETPVEVVVWGEKVKMENFPIPCTAGRFEVINLPPEPTYKAQIEGFKDLADNAGRIKYDIPEFVSGRGQNKSVNIDKYKKIVVSDMKVSWQFDSRSIDSCETAGIVKLRAELVSDSRTVSSSDQECDNKFSDLYIYNILEGKYVLYLYGFSSEKETLFESSLDVGEIEAGNIDDKILKETILLKEK